MSKNLKLFCFLLLTGIFIFACTLTSSGSPQVNGGASKTPSLFLAGAKTGQQPQFTFTLYDVATKSVKSRSADFSGIDP